MSVGIVSLNEGMGYIDLRMHMCLQCLYMPSQFPSKVKSWFRQQTVLGSGCKLPLLFQLCLDSFKINIVALLVSNCLTQLKKW